MSRSSHTYYSDLVAAYALHALGEDEALEAADHLRQCPRCRDEMDAHLETAARLAGGGEDAPSAIWERIAAELDAPSPPVELTFVRRQREIVRRALSVGAAAAAVAIAVLAWQTVRLEDRTEQLRETVARSDGAQAALAAFTDPAARRVQLTSPDGSITVAAAMLPDGRAWLLSEALPALPEDRIYQLWWIGEGRKESLGVLGRDPSVFSFKVTTAGLEMLAVTAEPAPGVTSTQAPPVVAGHVRV